MANKRLRNANDVLLVIFLLCCVKFSLAQSEPASPCPDLFQYRFDGAEWYGVTELPSPQLGQTIKLNVLLSLRAQLPTVRIMVFSVADLRSPVKIIAHLCTTPFSDYCLVRIQIFPN